MKKSTLFLTGMAALLLSFGLFLAGCPTDSEDSGPSFDGTTLAGTKWVAERTVMMDILGPGLSTGEKATLEFTSDTKGTYAFEITWNGPWTEEGKEKVREMMPKAGPITFTYDAAAKTGTYTRTEISLGYSETIEGTFIADVENKTLTTSEEEHGETETTIFKLTK